MQSWTSRQVWKLFLLVFFLFCLFCFVLFSSLVNATIPYEQYFWLGRGYNGSIKYLLVFTYLSWVLFYTENGYVEEILEGKTYYLVWSRRSVYEVGLDVCALSHFAAPSSVGAFNPIRDIHALSSWLWSSDSENKKWIGVNCCSGFMLTARLNERGECFCGDCNKSYPSASRMKAGWAYENLLCPNLWCQYGGKRRAGNSVWMTDLLPWYQPAYCTWSCLP